MDIRNLTYQSNGVSGGVSGGGIEKIKTYSSNKWTTLDDSIYDNLAELVCTEDKEKIADLLNIFYYFIICYSKTCFKKDANWNKDYKVFTHYKNKKKYSIGNTFDYDLANDLNSHSILLNMQKQLYAYRKEFSTIKQDHNLTHIRADIRKPDGLLYKEQTPLRNEYITKKYFTNEKIKEIIDFINESLYDVIKYITPPVKLISADIQAKINKYKNIKSKTRPNIPAKYNIEALKAILGYDANILSGTSNMVEFTFHSG